MGEFCASGRAIFMGVYIHIGLNFEQTIWYKTKVKLGTTWEHDENTLGRRKQKNPIQKFLDSAFWFITCYYVSQNP
jgi:hypothetical protein